MSDATAKAARDASGVKLPRASKGKRPHFFKDADLDQMMTFFMELMTEVMVLRDRQDTLERMLDEKGSISRADLDAYIPPMEVEGQRTGTRDAFVKRVLRFHAR